MAEEHERRPSPVRVRTLFMTYESDDDTADTFMVVLGSIVENFRGVKLVEYQDDTIFGEKIDMTELLHEMTTKAPLTKEQQRELDSFTAALANWDGEDSS